MEVIAAVEGRQQARRMGWIAGRLVEVDHSVERAARADPSVDGVAFLLAGFRVADEAGGAFERRERSADHPQAQSVRAQDDLAMPGDDLLRADFLPLQGSVIDALEEDDVPRPWLDEDVPVEPGKRAGSAQVPQHAIPRDPRVD